LPFVLFQGQQPQIEGCDVPPSWICERVFDATESEEWASFADTVVGTPLEILIIILVAYVVNRLVRKAIRRFASSLGGTSSSQRFRRLRGLRDRAPNVLLPTGELNLRASNRAETIGTVLRSVATLVIYGLATLTVLGELSINLGPLLAGAGIAGVAIGFGAQSLVKDFLSGLFMIIEDWYGVGDIVDAGEATGTVEGITLRTTRLRDVNGTVWHIPNGQILRVGNKSQQWARALIDVAVAYGADVRKAQEVIKRVADETWRDETWSKEILEEPEVWGVEKLGVSAVDIRLVVKTKPASQFKVMRELRARLKEGLDAAGIEMPLSQQTMFIRTAEGELPDDGQPAPTPPRKRAPAKKAAKTTAKKSG
jgi:moderate conductance mechanosensitive channel